MFCSLVLQHQITIGNKWKWRHRSDVFDECMQDYFLSGVLHTSPLEEYKFWCVTPEFGRNWPNLGKTYCLYIRSNIVQYHADACSKFLSSFSKYVLYYNTLILTATAVRGSAIIVFVKVQVYKSGLG